MFVYTLLTFTVLTFQISNALKYDRTLDDPKVYLSNFGYLGKDRSNRPVTRTELKDAIRLYQEETGLRVTGKLDQSTRQLMKKPRCGVPDVSVSSISIRRKRSIRKTAQKKQEKEHKWNTRSLSWKSNRYSSKLPIEVQNSILTEAFRRWSQPSEIRVTKTTSSPDLEIIFVSRNHGDGDYNAFDGKGQLLAHAFFPGNLTISGDVHFDADESWTHGVNKSESRDLMMIAMHEVGHALGLPHSKNRKDIMFPLYLEYNPDPQLNIGDMKKLQKFYGKRPGFLLSPRKTLKKVVKSEIISTKLCRHKVKAVLQVSDKFGYIFSGQKVYLITDAGVVTGYPVHVGHEFPGAPVDADVIFYVRDFWRTYFIKGSMMWRYTNTSLDSGFPKDSKSTFAETPKAALSTFDARGRTIIYFFGKTLIWRWNHNTEIMNGNYHLISTYWRSAPPHFDALVHWTDNYVYFFNNKKYYKLIAYNREMLEHYPKLTGPAWFKGECGAMPK